MTDKNGDVIKKVVMAIGVVFLLILTVMVLSYWNTFGCSLTELNSPKWNCLAAKSEAWGQFGDFFGGILNPVLTSISMLLLIYTVLHDREQTRKRDAESLVNDARYKFKLVLVEIEKAINEIHPEIDGGEAFNTRLLNIIGFINFNSNEELSTNRKLFFGRYVHYFDNCCGAVMENLQSFSLLTDRFDPAINEEFYFFLHIHLGGRKNVLGLYKLIATTANLYGEVEQKEINKILNVLKKSMDAHKQYAATLFIENEISMLRDMYQLYIESENIQN